MTTKVYTSNRTETRRADELVEGDHILDPEDRKPRILTIWRIERFRGSGTIWVDAMKSRSVTRKLYPSQPIDVCI